MVNPYLKQHKDFCVWIEREIATMPRELLSAAVRFRCALWTAAHRSQPPDGFDVEVASWAQAYANRDSGHRH